MKIHRLPILASIAALVVVAACSGGGATPSPASPSPSAGLDGRTFLSTGVVGRVLVAGSQVRIAFADGRIAVSAGCNSMSGAYQLDGTTLRVGQMMTTEMACDEPLMAQDEWVAALLDGATVALDGDTLTLSNGDVTLTLQDREVADPDRPLIGTRWSLDGIVTNDAVSSVPQGVTATLTFSEGRVDVEAGCNAGGGPVAIAEDTIEFGAIGLTKMACEAAAMAVEQAVATVLRGTVSYSIEASTLTLDAGGAGLMYRAAS